MSARPAGPRRVAVVQFHGAGQRLCLAADTVVGVDMDSGGAEHVADVLGLVAPEGVAPPDLEERRVVDVSCGEARTLLLVDGPLAFTLLGADDLLRAPAALPRSVLGPIMGFAVVDGELTFLLDARLLLERVSAGG